MFSFRYIVWLSALTLLLLGACSDPAQPPPHVTPRPDLTSLPLATPPTTRVPQVNIPPVKPSQPVEEPVVDAPSKSLPRLSFDPHPDLVLQSPILLSVEDNEAGRRDIDLASSLATAIRDAYSKAVELTKPHQPPPTGRLSIKIRIHRLGSYSIKHETGWKPAHRITAEGPKTNRWNDVLTLIGDDFTTTDLVDGWGSPGTVAELTIEVHDLRQADGAEFVLPIHVERGGPRSDLDSAWRTTNQVVRTFLDLAAMKVMLEINPGPDADQKWAALTQTHVGRGTASSNGRFLPPDIPASPRGRIPLLDVSGDTEPKVKGQVEIARDGQIKLSLNSSLTFVSLDNCNAVTVSSDGHSSGSIIFSHGEYTITGGLVSSERHVGCPVFLRLHSHNPPQPASGFLVHRPVFVPTDISTRPSCIFMDQIARIVTKVRFIESGENMWANPYIDIPVINGRMISIPEVAPPLDENKRYFVTFFMGDVFHLPYGFVAPRADSPDWDLGPCIVTSAED